MTEDCKKKEREVKKKEEEIMTIRRYEGIQKQNDRSVWSEIRRLKERESERLEYNRKERMRRKRRAMKMTLQGDE